MDNAIDYTRFRAKCQGVLEKFFQFFEKTFPSLPFSDKRPPANTEGLGYWGMDQAAGSVVGAVKMATPSKKPAPIIWTMASVVGASYMNSV